MESVNLQTCCLQKECGFGLKNQFLKFENVYNIHFVVIVLYKFPFLYLSYDCRLCRCDFNECHNLLENFQLLSNLISVTILKNTFSFCGCKNIWMYSMFMKEKIKQTEINILLHITDVPSWRTDKSIQQKTDNIKLGSAADQRH